MTPDSARAHWLRSGLLLKAGRHQEALSAARRAVELEKTNPRYRLSCAEALWHCENPTDALLECQAAVDLARDMPHVKAAVLLLIGDIHAEEPLSDFKKAIQFHMKAIEIAEPAAEDRHPAIRLAAKQVLVDAHLAAAVDVASGNWQNKEVAVVKWLAGAGSRNEDLIAETGHAEEHRLRLAAAALRACAGAKDNVDPAPWGKSLMENAIVLIKERKDPLYRSWVRGQAAAGMADCLRVSHWRGETEQALSCGEAAWEWLETDLRGPYATDADRLLLGRICFMTGSIHALVRESHEDAVPWFDRSSELLMENTALAGRANRTWAGDCLVSMGVSYWQTGNREKAVEMTARGAALLESLVVEGHAEPTRLSVPYGNLAAMHGELGESDKAELFARKSKETENPAVRTARPFSGETLLR
jgi:tetratricopeptide (TPR) repeat protein